MENLYYNNKSFLLENNQLYEDLSENTNNLYEENNSLQNGESVNIEKIVNIIEKNEDNQDFMNGLISIINGEKPNAADDQRDDSSDISSMIDNLNNIEKSLKQFEIKI